MRITVQPQPDYFERGDVWIVREDGRVIAICPTEADARRIALVLQTVPTVTPADEPNGPLTYPSCSVCGRPSTHCGIGPNYTTVYFCKAHK